MRTAVIESIHALMKKDEQIYFLTGDLGYSVLEKIEHDFPLRFINVGVAEQNMIGIAAGLALSGKKVYVYSIIPFITMRCFEQIRDDVCYHNLDVTLIGVGSGLSYGILGSTHFALEDIGILRCVPNMTIVSPIDSSEAQNAIRVLYQQHGPLYFRLGKKEEPDIYTDPQVFVLGKGVILRKGKDITIFTTGTIACEVIEACMMLENKFQITTTLINMHSLKPFDKQLTQEASKNKKAVFTVEEHSVIGGLGSAVAETLAECAHVPTLIRIGTHDQFIHHIGSQQYLRKKLGLSANGIVQTILFTLKKGIY